MNLECFLAKDLSQTWVDSLQQIQFDFPVNFIFTDSDSLKSLPTGSLFVDNEGAKIQALEHQKAVSFSWLKLQAHWRSEASKVKASPVLKALGAKPGQWVIDATCGTGRDSSYFLHHGINVEAYERNKSIFFLLKVSQFLEDFLRERLIINYGEASKLAGNSCERVGIYFDPMFDDGQNRKAKPKKQMEVFHSVVGIDQDALEQALALRNMSKRLVIKRSPRDGALIEKPSSTWQTKSVRFDLYL